MMLNCNLDVLQDLQMSLEQFLGLELPVMWEAVAIDNPPLSLMYCCWHCDVIVFCAARSACL
jgi:hypothetical protein